MDTKVYTMKDVMVMLKLSKCTVYRLAREGKFPVVKLGKRYLSPKNAFDNWLESKAISNCFV
jgi:excisionase family DNA binding protein